MLKQWLESYQAQSIGETNNAMREILQEIALAGLYRAGFYKHAAFYGGTALRIFYGLPRFSEDLDFSLLAKDPSFKLKPFLNAVIDEFSSLGLQVSIIEKKKSIESAVDSAFLKTDTIWKEIKLEQSFPELQLGTIPSIKIKIEVDTMPPKDFETESKLLVKPFSFYVNTFTLPCLFAGKLHALLFRKWKNRVKGRDWFDLEWYIKKDIPLNFNHFVQRAVDSGDLENHSISKVELLNLLHQKIADVDFKKIKDDIVRFIAPKDDQTAIWNAKYFTDLTDLMKIE
ncbi:MAG: nucleotidyl transferase AbiEii/AbiGii toxin family protein [Sphingobacteriia bacterium]|nr:MAG: nucleotidyl transferase AbiEii/AbiGii toxin family protein [Sphingobacteriia bacterium]